MRRALPTCASNPNMVDVSLAFVYTTKGSVTDLKQEYCCGNLSIDVMLLLVHAAGQ